MQKYVPDIYVKNIYKVPYKKLKEKGINHLLFDLDNTVVPAHEKKAPQEVKKLFLKLKKEGFVVILFSNSPHKRLIPFGKDLEVEFNAFSMKPLQRSFYKILGKYQVSKEKVAIIGDQILTDIIGGNKAGITTVLTTPLTSSDMLITKGNRMRENHIMKRLEKKNLWNKGEYYDEKV